MPESGIKLSWDDWRARTGDRDEGMDDIYMQMRLVPQTECGSSCELCGREIAWSDDSMFWGCEAAGRGTEGAGGVLFCHFACVSRWKRSSGH